MKCLDCDKVFLYPVVERGKDTALCPACFGSNLSDVSDDELALARSQRWYFDRKPEPPTEMRVAMVAVPVEKRMTPDYWLGYILETGEKLRMMVCGSEAYADHVLEEWKLSGGTLSVPLHGMIGKHEEVQAIYVVKMQATEAYRLVPKASEVIEAVHTTTENADTTQ